MTTPKREPAKLTVKPGDTMFYVVDRRGPLFLSGRFLRLIGARPGDRLRIESAPGKITLTLEPKKKG